ncbi:MAG: porin [Sheuella sp.]|nr:porin [Sheuella sp.]
MKKTLLAAALLAGFAGAASAQSSVTLYGILDAGLVYKNVKYSNGPADVNNSNFGMAYGTQSGNRLGFKGVEDMGNGNRLTFQLENGFDIGNGTAGQGSRLFGRQAWFGVENDAWGYARMGRQLNFASDYFGALDPFSQGFAQANIGSVFGSTNTYRLSNALKYQTPNMGGFTAGVMYSFATGIDSLYVANGANVSSGSAYAYDTTNNTRQISLGAKYANGPIYVAASYDKLYGATGIAGGSPDASPSEWNLGGSYDFKVVKVDAVYGQTRGGWMAGQNNQGNSGASISIPGRTVFGGGLNIYDTNWGVNSYQVGLTAPIGGASKVFASWNMAMPNGNMQEAYDAKNMSSYNLGYSYDFTKRTNMYAYVSYANNYGTIDGLTSTVLGVGLRHQF